MLLVDEAVMYESNALNKKLTCQTSPLVISLPSAGFWCKLSLSCGAWRAWPHRRLGAAAVPVGVPWGGGTLAWLSGQFAAPKQWEVFKRYSVKSLL